jgi:hypothetical protein
VISWVLRLLWEQLDKTSAAGIVKARIVLIIVFFMNFSTFFLSNI